MKTILTVFALTFAIGCATSDTNRDARMAGEPQPHEEGKDAVSIEAKLAGAQLGTPHVTEIKFNRGTADLKKAELTRLDTALKAAAKNKKIEKVTVVTWGDAVPTDENHDQQSKLAQTRAEFLKNHIAQTRKEIEFSLVNTVDEPSKINEFLKTEDARIKKSFEKNGSQGVKTSKAVILITTEGATKKVKN